MGEVREASVRATHDFLKVEDIVYFKPLIQNEYLSLVSLRCIKDDKKNIVGFLGVAKQNLEMLFIHPLHRGKGIGKSLLQYAITEMEAQKVDVNEQNPLAVGFYIHNGFKTIKRSELDASGKPYPILLMKL